MTVSYCIPLYNKRRYIAAVLDAALAERAVTGGEVVVYDDASTDGSLELVRAKAVEHSIIVIEAERNRGVFDATTALIGRAGHPYLRLIDADDVIVPGSTGHLVDLLRQHQAVLAHGVIEASRPPILPPPRLRSKPGRYGGCCAISISICRPAPSRQRPRIAPCPCRAVCEFRRICASRFGWSGAVGWCAAMRPWSVSRGKPTTGCRVGWPRCIATSA
jgi:hypothetical protein